MKKVPQNPAEARESHLESVFWRRFLLWGLENVPLPLQRMSIPLWSAFFYVQVPHIRRAIEQNLSRLRRLPTPTLELMAFHTFTNYCHCVANAYRLHLGAEPNLPVEVTGLELLQKALSSQRGAILATGHLGNWQIGPYFLARHGLPPLTVVMSEEPDPSVQKIEASLRDQRLRVVYPQRSPWLSLELRASLNKGELVGFQMDRPPAKRGIKVRCAGSEVTFSAGPALLARTCDVPVIPVFFPRTSQGISIQVKAPLWSQQTKDPQKDMVELTHRLAQIYEQMIHHYPFQWFNFYDFWQKAEFPKP